ncbi:MFS transporter [Streptomyces acidiscabies]|uniref:MFS transporter n=1 Tax=Streptomyces acidiscabies TaxID=42234 RepID=UPI000951A350|nr:MFS transporter [Streptomyces acidiscabies]
MPTGRSRFLPHAVLYASQAGCSVSLSAISPTLAEARRTWPMSYAAIGLYPSLLAASMVVSGLGYARWSARWGRARVLGAASAVLSASAVLFSVAPDPTTLLIAATGLGLSSTVLQAGVIAVLVDASSARRASRLALNGLCASLASLIGPLLVTAAAHTDTGWRCAWWWPALWFLLLALLLPSAARGGPVAVEAVSLRAVLPASYWLVSAGVAAGVAAELCVVFFAPRSEAAAAVPSAGAVLLLYYAGESTGRAVGFGVIRRSGREASLLAGSLLTATAGFGVFWLADSSTARLIGLMAAGAGIAGFFPVGASLASSRAPGAADRAMSRLHLLVGVAAFVSPLLLGALADRVGLRAGFVLVPVLFLAMACLLALGTRSRLPVPLLPDLQKETR